METKTLFLSRMEAQERIFAIREKAQKRVKILVAQKEVPKIVKLLQKVDPQFNNQCVTDAVTLLAGISDFEDMKDAMQSIRQQAAACQIGSDATDLAHALIQDLLLNVDIDNPSKSELERSAILRLPRLHDVRYDKVRKFISVQKNLAEEKKIETSILPSIREAVEHMHSVVRVFYYEGNRRTETLDYYETLSQMMKRFTPRSWKATSDAERVQRVPELAYWDEEKRQKLEEDFLRIFA